MSKAESAQSSKLLKVLVVDDNRYVTESLAAVLRDYGCHVATAENGVAALASCQQSAPDVLVSDLRMPLMDGPQLAARVCTLFPACKIILFSGTVPCDTFVSCPKCHDCFFPLFARPVNPPKLVDMVLGRVTSQATQTDKPNPREQSSRHCDKGC